MRKPLHNIGEGITTADMGWLTAKTISLDRI